MLFRILLTIAFVSPYSAYCSEAIAKGTRPYAVLPVPFELPNRNDRSNQCWLRIEDVEVTETVTVYCYIAQGFLRSYIHDYNSMKMSEDDVDVTLWSEEPRPEEDNVMPKSLESNRKVIKDWRITTVKDPITLMRLYVSQSADCKLIMYTREGMTNYKVDCDRILFYFNSRMNGSSTINRIPYEIITVTSIALILLKL